MGKILGKRIKMLREGIGLKQDYLATRLNVKQSAVSMWETGRTTPPRATLNKLAELFDCELSSLHDKTYVLCISEFSLDALVDEISQRGWRVKLERIA